MAKHQKNNRGQSALGILLNMFHLLDSTTVPSNADDDMNSNVNKQPDESIHIDPPAIQQQLYQKIYTKSEPLPLNRKELLLTHALMTDSDFEAPSLLPSPILKALS